MGVFPPGTVARAASSSQLQQHLTAPVGSPQRPRVILTTIQKLSSLWRARAGGAGGARAAAGSSSSSGGGSAPGRVAVIADEAHRHHGSSTSEQISAIMAAAFIGGSGASGSSGARAINARILAAGRQAADSDGVSAAALVQQPRFVTYVGFTATPGPRALQLFGVAQPVLVDSLGGVHAQTRRQQQRVQKEGQGQQQQQEEEQQEGQDAAAGAAQGPPEGMLVVPATLYSPFHAYSLQQSTTDGLVLDALQNFVAVTPRFEISGLTLTEQQRRLLMRLDAAAAAAAAGGGSAGGAAADSAAAAKRVRLGLGLAVAEAALPAGGARPGGHQQQQQQQQSLAAALLVGAASNSRALVAVKAQEVVVRFVEAWSRAAAAGFTGFRCVCVCVCVCVRVCVCACLG
jgi:hypothetical protein